MKVPLRVYDTTVKSGPSSWRLEVIGSHNADVFRSSSAAVNFTNISTTADGIAADVEIDGGVKIHDIAESLLPVLALSGGAVRVYRLIPIYYPIVFVLLCGVLGWAAGKFIR